jgi:hypothetical protein
MTAFDESRYMPNLDVLTLTGWHLDYYTGVALGYEMFEGHPFTPTTSGGDLGVVLERMTTILQMGPGRWQARVTGGNVFAPGLTVQVAVCRALVRHVLGATVPAIGGSVADCEDLFA